MTRKLPWKRVEIGSISTPRSLTSTPISQQKAKRENTDDDDKQATASPTPAKRVKSSHSVPASPAPKITPQLGSSPPSLKPLPESYMIEGLDHDDLYRMVEDEFLSTAQQFTAHLHAAEYHRLKAASKSQNADTIRDISRPVVGQMTDLVKQKQERKARLEKQKAATRKARADINRNDDSTASESDLWRSASLHGLMESPRKKAARLDKLTKVVTTTRAAAGFSTAKSGRLFPTSHPIRKDITGSRPIPKSTPQQDSETESDDDEDLDGPSTKMSTNSVKKPLPSMAQLPKPRQVPSTTSNNHPLRRSENIHPIIQQPEAKTTTEAASSSSSEADGNGDFLSRLKQRQEDRKRNREQRKQAASNKAQSSTTDDIIPGFL
ncbi:hypothetical protein F4813DRAFT_252536 [Daldinia decipiens]|uniref:uncharacterized protein n=1 Tax=Daldinia decipiens TaxID=326647 RepID=UPI0020C26EF1|nr:uncharacterized protein F4813DRAFT_252536 [Daldinia decipiens]KAI1653565.1 hypothetical protein F4813DRAFT_252536 [Daldinia decipiens]